MLLLTGFGALRTKLSLLTVSFGLVGTNPELPFSWKNNISIPGSKNQGSLSQRGKKRTWQGGWGPAHLPSSFLLLYA